MSYFAPSYFPPSYFGGWASPRVTSVSVSLSIAWDYIDKPLMMLIRNVSQQSLAILVSDVAWSRAGDIAPAVRNAVSIRPGGQLAVAEDRTDAGQIARLRSLGLLRVTPLGRPR